MECEKKFDGIFYSVTMEIFGLICFKCWNWNCVVHVELYLYNVQCTCTVLVLEIKTDTIKIGILFNIGFAKTNIQNVKQNDFLVCNLEAFSFPIIYRYSKYRLWRAEVQQILFTDNSWKCMWRINFFSMYELSKNEWAHYWLTCSFTQFVVVYSAFNFKYYIHL